MISPQNMGYDPRNMLAEFYEQQKIAMGNYNNPNLPENMQIGRKVYTAANQPGIPRPVIPRPDNFVGKPPPPPQGFSQDALTKYLQMQQLSAENPQGSPLMGYMQQFQKR